MAQRRKVVWRQLRGLRILAVCSATCLLYACSAAPARVASPATERAYQQRQHSLLALEQWRLSGKLAASDGKDGGSGNFTWANSFGFNSMSFRGALGKGAWELETGDGGADLRFADGRHYVADSVADLVSAHMQVKVPVEAMSWWVLGLAEPNGWDERELDEAGRITYLRQAGWVVTFSGYELEQEHWLPGKLVARNRESSVKLVISDWALASEADKLD